jgi:hypothetical protein
VTVAGSSLLVRCFSLVLCTVLSYPYLFACMPISVLGCYDLRVEEAWFVSNEDQKVRTDKYSRS